MNDERTQKEKYHAWLKALNFCYEKGWYCENGWIFKSPSGTLHDLSAADLNKLKEIEENKLFLV